MTELKNTQRSMCRAGVTPTM